MSNVLYHSTIGARTHLFDVIRDSAPPDEMQQTILSVRHIDSTFSRTWIYGIGTFPAKSSSRFECKKYFSASERHFLKWNKEE